MTRSHPSARRLPAPNRPYLALGLRLVAALALSTLYSEVKLAHQHGLSLPEIMFWRQSISLPILFGWLALSGRLEQLRTTRLKAHAIRAGMGTFGMVTNFGAAILLPLPVATVLGFTTPLFAVLLTALLLSENVGSWRWLAVGLGFAGVLIIAQPGSAASMQISPLGAAAGLMSGFMVALISLHIRDLAQTDSPISVVFYFALFSTMILAPIMPFVMDHHSTMMWLEILGIGLVGTLAQVLLTASLRFGSAASVLVMDYTSLIWTTLYGHYLFDQLPPAHTWLGAPLIVAAGMAIGWYERRKLRPDAA